MFVKKDTILDINHSRKGQFRAIALENFDTNKTEFYPVAIALLKGKPSAVRGLNPNNIWVAGDAIPCRNTLCIIKIVKN